MLEAVPNPRVLLSLLATQEAVLSSKIEGTQATMGQVLEYEAGAAPASDDPDKVRDIKEILNYRKAVHHAEKSLARMPLAGRLIKEAHAILMEGVRGKTKQPGEYRREQNWSGATRHIEEARFVPIAWERLEDGMAAWERYIHGEEKDLLVQLAILHAEFEALHPFLDSNGRLGRLLVPLYLHDRKLLKTPTFYLSAYLEVSRSFWTALLLPMRCHREHGVSGADLSRRRTPSGLTRASRRVTVAINEYGIYSCAHTSPPYNCIKLIGKDLYMAVFARIGRLFNGFIGLFISGIEERNPEMLMESARQEFRDKMAQYNSALARMAGIAERLKAQIGQKTTRAGDLERRIMANHRAGNLELAGSLARELQELRADITTDTGELSETEDAYQANLRQAKVAQKDFSDKVMHMERQLSQVKVKEAQAEAAGALSNVAFKVGDLGDTMKNVEEILNKRYEQSAGKARLARDMVDLEKVQEKETERKALESTALADFLASQGVAAAPGADVVPTVKEMGPAQAQ